MKYKIPLILAFIFQLISCSTQKQIPFSIQTVDGISFIQLNEDGTIEVQGVKVGSLQSTTTVVNLDNEIIASLDNENILLDTHGKKLVKIMPDGNIDNGSGQAVFWSKNGEMDWGGQAKFQLNPNNPKFYQIASMLLWLNFTVSEKYTNPK